MRLPILATVLGVSLSAVLVIYIILAVLDTLDDDSSLVVNLVCEVRADPITPGTAYAALNQGWCNNGSRAYYVTRDYGQTWSPVLDFNTIPWNEADMLVEGTSYNQDVILYNEQPVWSLPRPTFRWMFFPSTSIFYTSPLFWNSSAGVDATYYAMGAFGVLVGPNPPDAPGRWTITSSGLSELNPPALTFSNPLIIALITILGLTVPPLTWLHGWFIGQAWRYAYPEGEADVALAQAVRVARGITFLAAGAVVIWLTNINIDFYEIVALMTVLTVAIGIYEAWQLARRRHYSRGFTLRLALATALLSLIVPAGVALTTTGTGWPIILSALSLFIFLRQGFSDQIEREGGHATRWQIDRIALELLILVVLAGYWVIWFYERVPVAWCLGVITGFIIPLLALLVYSTWRALSIPQKQGRQPDEDAFIPVRLGAGWVNTLAGHLAGGVGVAVLLSVFIFSLQAVIYRWFTTLLLRF
jgi:hypothetical protein